jgi:hypothetical protein
VSGEEEESEVNVRIVLNAIYVRFSNSFHGKHSDCSFYESSVNDFLHLENARVSFRYNRNT